MGNVAISVNHLTKRYSLGLQPRHDTLRDRVAAALFWWKPSRSDEDGKGREFAALTDVSFDVKSGEVFGMIGHNGAGKSTLLKILSRITAPTSGSADIYGRVGSLLEVGTGFHPELTGRENIFLNGSILGMRRAEITAKLEEIIDFAGVEEFIDTPVKRYSSGMYVRLAFSVAAHFEPDILIVDEVLAVGDAGFQQKCLGKMRQASQGGRTVLVVSHNLPLIENLCERALFLSQGRVAVTGPVRDVVQAYAGMTADLARSALDARTDRQGKGQVIATAIEVLARYRNPAFSAICGREAIVRWHYRCLPDTIIRRCRVELSLHARIGDSYETAYFLMSTDLVSPLPLDLSGEGYIDFRVPEWPLSGGQYYVMSYVERDKEVQDWVHGASLLSVVDRDFYGTGKSYPPNWRGKSVLIKYDWTQTAREAVQSFL
ncbi:MAG: ABC transporter ATP-binding protein [Nitrospira sp.]|nr:ABC transporter ATP-binding protein [Nitrospira sp.]MCE7976757.1 ABC transporter ATP-binding protein [Nitrospira sp. NTP1]HQR14711.1 ABC transporter ATP-binding protein [Nitrospira sp.]